MTLVCLKPFTSGPWLLAACIATACTAAPVDGPGAGASPPVKRADAKQPQAAGAASLADIEALIGDAACRTSQDCRVIGVGASACGGPEAYRAWSSWRTPAAQLERLVSENAAARRSQLDSQGMASVCTILPTPGVACSPRASAALPAGASGTCTLQPSVSGV